MKVEAGVLVDYLNKFESSDEIAEYFISIGVKGYRQDETSCPIASWLHSRLDCSVSVEDKVTVFDDSWIVPEAVYDLSEAAQEFITRFDLGNWDELDADRCNCGECNGDGHWDF